MDRRVVSTLALGAAATAMVIALCPGAVLGGPASSGDALFFVPTPERVVALTIDDGPSDGFTPRVLDTLSRHGAHATFFVVGDAAMRRPDLIARELAQGDEIGDHTWSHPRMERLDPAAVALEISRGADAVRRLAGAAPRFFRPPRGADIAEGVAVAGQLGMRTVMWSVAVEHDLGGTPQEMSRYVLDHARPGSIVLMHDGLGDRSKSVAALDLVLQGLTERGYRVVSLSELLREAR